MHKQPQITEQTRANLREAFWGLYTERPIEKIPVREICQRAGYNRATFYLYYHDVYELLAEIEDMFMGGAELLINERLMCEETLDFSQHMGFILRLARDSQSYMEVLLGPGGDPAFAERLKAVIAPLVERFVLPAEGLGEQDRAVLMEFYLSGLLAAIRLWLAQDNPMPIDQLIPLVVSNVLR